MVKDWKAFREEAAKAAEDGYILILGDLCPELEEITIECLLTAKSNGFNILQLCNKRVAMNSSLLMYHWGSCTLDNDEISAIVSGEKWPLERIFMAQHLQVEEISRRTKVAKQTLESFASQEREFSGREALELGFIDEIIDSLPGPVKMPELEK